MTITCYCMYEFCDVIHGLTTRGLGFTADAHQLAITLTRSY